MRFNDRAMALAGIPDLPPDAFKKEGGKIKLHGGGGSPPAQQTVTQTTIPEYARPYVERTLGKAEALTSSPYQTYGGERIAPFSNLQQRYLAGAGQLGPTQQISEASGITSDVAARAGQAGYMPQYFGNQYRAPGQYRPGQFGVRDVMAPRLQQFQMGPAERVRSDTFVRPGTAEAFMSPYQQAVTDIEKREAMRQSNIQRQQQQAQAVQQGAFGGARSAIVEAERQRNLGMQLGDIQARGGQAAYDRAMQQFNAEQQARLQAQLANQAAGLTTGQANLQSLLGVQQLGAGQSLQSQLANQQAMQEAQRAAEQSRQFGYGQGMTAQQLAAQYGLAGQQATEQSRQFGATYGLEGLKQQLSAAQQLGQLGQTEFAQQQQSLRELQQAGGMQQALRQQELDKQYQDFLSQRGNPYQQLAFMSDLLRGGPLSQTTSQIYTAPPSAASQLAGFGLGAYGLNRLFNQPGAKDGGLMGIALKKMEEA